jgi:hypothetical protein
VADLHGVRFLRADGTHGFSDQYYVELPLFLECAREAGLRADDRYHPKFPASDLATVSVIFFTALAGASGPESIASATVSHA